jgi:NitT/TauT family transport system substrate-binding protein
MRGLRMYLLVQVLLTGCSGESAPPAATDNTASTLYPMVLQLDWYAQAEHGGFYQAVAKGYYAAEGLAVEIRPGGNLNTIPQLVATGRVDFALGVLDRMLVQRSQGVPLVTLFPYFQHDPQCIVFHKESGIQTLADLKGREVMMDPGLIYIDFLQKALSLDLHLLPMDYSLARFLLDKQFVQQCFLTNEPLILQKQGIEAEVIPLSASGFDPYRHVYTNEDQIKQHPDQVAAFIRASLRGWRDFMDNDPLPAFTLIAQSNPAQPVELLQELHGEMRRYTLTDGDASKGEMLGQYNKARLRTVIEQLRQLDLLRDTPNLESSVAFALLPPALVVEGTPTTEQPD